MSADEKKSIFDLIQIKDISGDILTNTAEQRYGVYELCSSFDPHFAELPMRKAVEQFNGIPEGAAVEYFSLNTRKNTQVQTFLEEQKSFLLKENVLYQSKHTGFKQRRNFMSISLDKQNAKRRGRLDMDRIAELAGAFNLKNRQLDTDEIQQLLYFLINHDPVFRHTSYMTPKERILQHDITYTADTIAVNGVYAAAVTMLDFEETDFFDMHTFLDRFDFEYLFSASFHMQKQAIVKKIVDMYRRFAISKQQKNEHLGDIEAESTAAEAQDLLELAHEEGHRFGRMTVRFILWDTSRARLQKHMKQIRESYRDKLYMFYNDTLQHDRAVMETLPSQTFRVDKGRTLMVPAQNYLEFLPLGNFDSGDMDSEFPFICHNRYGFPFAFDPFSKAGMNYNWCIFGSSGSGKSFLVNLIIMNSVIPRIQKHGGKLFVIDFAGKEDSSYIKVVELFGGAFIPIDATGDVSINPFPPRSEALDERGDIRPQTLTFLQIILDTVIENTARDKESDLYRGIVRKGIETMYREDADPDIEKLAEYISDDTDDDREKVTITRKLLDNFLASGDSRLIKKTRGLADYRNKNFIIFDLQGVLSLSPKMREIMTYIVMQESRKICFGAHGYKYFFYDEVAQLIKDERMVSLIDEMFATGRKYNSSILAITQNYSTYKKTGMSELLSNSSKTIFLRQDNAAARREVAEDFEFTAQEKEHYKTLELRKGTYSEALIRYQRGEQLVTQIMRIRASKFAYFLATSDGEDKKKIRAYARENRCSLLDACAALAGYTKGARR